MSPVPTDYRRSRFSSSSVLCSHVGSQARWVLLMTFLFCVFLLDHHCLLLHPLTPRPRFFDKVGGPPGTSLPMSSRRPDLSCVWEMLGFFICSFGGFRMLTCTQQPLLKVRSGQIFLFKRGGLLFGTFTYYISCSSRVLLFFSF